MKGRYSVDLFLPVICFSIICCREFAVSSDPLNVLSSRRTAGSCPAECICTSRPTENRSRPTYITSLTVDCQGRKDVDLDQLDLLLMGNQTYGHLRSLWIVNTPLTHVPRSVCRLTTLTQLHLDDNQLVRLPDNCFTNLTNLTSITASRNNITRLQDGLFDGLHMLDTLLVDNNRILSIGLLVFNGSAMLTSLRIVGLSANRLKTLEPWPYYVGINGQLDHRVEIDLADNNISAFANTMGWKAKCGMKAVYFNLILTRNPIIHVSDLLRGWNMSLSTWWCLSPYIKQGRQSSYIILEDVYLDCDCVDFNVFKIAFSPYVHSILLNKVYCNSPVTLYNKQVNTIPLDQFVCELTERCPSGCRCVHRPANATLHIYCSNANLTVLPFQLPELPYIYTKYKLNFSNNQLVRRLEHRNYFANTSILDVSYCGIKQVENWRELLNVRVVYLHGNRLSSLPPSVADMNSTTEHMTLYDNPWKCTCESRWMAKWLKFTSQIAGDVSCKSPERLRSKSIRQISDEELCVDPVSEARSRAVMVSTLSSAAVAGVLLSVIAIFYRLRVRLYTRWRFHPFDRDECPGEDMDYDVFLCCSSLDDRRSGRVILGSIESRGYRVCYHERDFMPGLILDNIEASVTRSKRTVCLLTDNFIRRFALYSSSFVW